MGSRGFIALLRAALLTVLLTAMAVSTSLGSDASEVKFVIEGSGSIKSAAAVQQQLYVPSQPCALTGCWEIEVQAEKLEAICKQIQQVLGKAYTRVGSTPLFIQIDANGCRATPGIAESPAPAKQEFKQDADRNISPNPAPAPQILSPSFSAVKIESPDMQSAPRQPGLSRIKFLYSAKIGSAFEYEQLIHNIVDVMEDRARPVKLEVWICELREGALSDLGVKFDGAVGTSLTERASGTDGSFEVFSIGDMTRGSGFNIGAKLHMLVEQKKAKILANPTLNTMDGVTASYFALERVPYLSSFTVTNSAPVGGVGYLDLGLSLFFEPSIEKGNRVRLKVLPVVSSLVEMMPVADGILAPRVAHRQLQGEFTVGDEETVCLASLITEEERTVVHKLPLLGELPALGKLFQKKYKDRERKEIVIFVKPVILCENCMDVEVPGLCIPDAIGCITP